MQVVELRKTTTQIYITHKMLPKMFLRLRTSVKVFLSFIVSCFFCCCCCCSIEPASYFLLRSQCVQCVCLLYIITGFLRINSQLFPSGYSPYFDTIYFPVCTATDDTILPTGCAITHHFHKE